MSDPLEDLKAIRATTNPLDDLKDIRSQSTRTSTPMPSVAAKARQTLASKGVSPEMVKLNPPTAQPTYPGDSSSWFDTGVVRPDPRQFSTNLKPGGDFWKTAGTMINPFAWVAGPMGELLAPTNPITSGNIAASSDSNDSSYNPTVLNLPDRLVSSVLPHPIDLAKESYSRGEQGKSTSDMYAIPATMAATVALPKVGRAILPADIAGEMARKTMSSALGTTPENFKHGATPDTAALQNDNVVTRSEGRLLNKITDSKHAELNGLENDLNTPQHNDNFTDPMQSIKPVLDDAMSRAVPAEQPKIAEFQILLNNKIQALSGGRMQLNPTQLVGLKRWLDGFISTYKDEPVSTYKDLAQNTYSAVRQHLDSVAPEATVRGQRIQSLIQAEDALRNKITGNVEAPHTSFGELKNIAGTVFPSTLVKTGMANALKMLSGGQFDKPPQMNLGIVNPTTPQGGTFNPPQPPQAGAFRGGTTFNPPNPNPLLLAPPTGMAVTPWGTAIPQLDMSTGMAGGVPETPRAVTPSTASSAGAPTSIDPWNAATQAGQHYLGELQSGARPSGITPTEGPPSAPITSESAPPVRAKTEAKVAAMTKSPADVNPEVAAANKEHNANAVKLLNDKYPIKNGEAVPVKRFPATPPPTEVPSVAETKAAPSTSAQVPDKPTHIQEGMSVSGTDAQGNLVSGKLEKVYPVVVDGKPIWKGTILDVKNGRTVDLPTDSIFDKLAGPPKSAIKAAPKPKPAAEIPGKPPTPAMEMAPTDKGTAAKKAVQDWLDKQALARDEEQNGAGPPRKRGK